MSVATNDPDFRYSWEDDNGGTTSPNTFNFAQAFCAVLAGITWACTAFGLNWGPTVTVFGDRVTLTWSMVVFPLAAVIFAKGMRGRFGSTLLTAFGLTLACSGIAVLAQLAFGGTGPALPSFLT